MLEPGTWTQIASTIATLLAVVVALFKERILSWYYAPKLTIQARPHPPDIDHIPFRFERPGTPPGFPREYGSIDSYFLRLWIKNEGKTRAEKVQVFVSEVINV